MRNKIIVTALLALVWTFNSYSMQLPEGSTEKARVIQPDGKTLILSQGKHPYTWEISRFNADKKLDATFGSSGHTGLVDSWDIVFIPLSIEIQPDGKILVINILRDGQGVEQYVQTRLNSDGTLDPFANGRVIAPIARERIP